MCEMHGRHRRRQKAPKSVEGIEGVEGVESVEGIEGIEGVEDIENIENAEGTKGTEDGTDDMEDTKNTKDAEDIKSVENVEVAVEKAYAKLNLCLAVGRKAECGYHYVESVVQTLSLSDTLVAEKTKKAGNVELAVAGARLPEGEKNIAYRAARLFFEASRVGGGARLRLEKRIPIAAGLGGGSADAAAVLRALNRLYAKPLTLRRLLELAGSLGADVPFCLRGGTAFAEGFGEKLSFLPQTAFYYVLMKGEKRLPTPLMYSLLDEKGGADADASACRDALARGDREGAARLASNSFLALATEKCPSLTEHVAFLLQNGAKSACVTGKGPTVFGVFTDREKAHACFEAAQRTRRPAARGVRGAAVRGPDAAAVRKAAAVFFCESVAGVDAEFFAKASPEQDETPPG